MIKFFPILLIFLITPCLAQEDISSRIVNVGYGVFVIGFGTVVAVIICLIGRATRYPEFFFLFSLIIPIFLILFFVLAPKEAQRAQNDQQAFQTDGYLIPRYIYLVIFIITFSLTSCCVCRFRYFGTLFAVRVGTVHQEDKDNFFDNEAEKQGDLEKNEKSADKVQSPKANPHPGSGGIPFDQLRSKEFTSDFNIKSENVSMMVGKGAGRSIFKRKLGDGGIGGGGGPGTGSGGGFVGFTNQEEAPLKDLK